MSARSSGRTSSSTARSRSTPPSSRCDALTVEADRIEVRFGGAQEAVGRLYALAQALVNDYERFEALVEEGEAASGGGEVRE